MGLIVFILFLVLLGVIILYVGWIGLLIFLGIGVVIGLVYAIYIYIKSLISATKGLGNVRAKNAFLTFLLKWFTLYKLSCKYAFSDNFSVARNAWTKAHNYKVLSFRRWMWFVVSPATLIFGTLLIFAVTLLQGILMLVACVIALYLVFLLCVVMLLAGLVYGFVATVVNFKLAFAGKQNVFTGFDFTLAAKLSDLPSKIKTYWSTVISYIVGIWTENFALGKSNIRMASGYRLFSIQRYFLYVSIVGLIVAALVFDLVLLVLMLLLFPLMIVVNFVWILIAMIVRAV